MTAMTIRIEETDQNGILGDAEGGELALVGWDWDVGALDVPADQDLAQWSDGACVLTSGAWDLLGDLPVADVGDEEDHPGPSPLSAKSFASALRHLPDPRKERAKALKQARLKVVSEDDYDDPVQRKLVRLMRLRAQVILKGEDGAQEYLRWYFSPPTGGEMEFEACAIFLGADPQSIRLRLQSYLYRHWVILNEPIDFLVAPPPEEILSRGIYYAGASAECLLRAAWDWPGIPIPALAQAAKARGFNEKTAMAAIEHLLESRLMLEQVENCYVVGDYGRQLERKNPWR